MKLGVYSIVFNDMPLAEAAHYFAKLGYEALEIAAEKRSRHLDMDRVLSESSHAAELKKILRDNGLFISALGNHFDGQLVLGPHDVTTDSWSPAKTPEDKIRHGIEQMKRTAYCANALEVPVVTAFVGSQVWGHWYGFPPMNLELYERAWEVFAERWNPILDVYAEQGVKLALEVHPTEIAYNIETAERALQALNYRKEFGFTLDPSHFVWQLIDPVIFAKKFHDRIFNFHAKDAELQKDELARSGVIPTGSWSRMDRGFRFRVVGWGQVEWKRLISVLAEIGYDYVLHYEHEDPVFSREEGCEKAAAYLLPLLVRKPIKSGEFGSWWKTDNVAMAGASRADGPKEKDRS
jgi:sugar phosphate isomerase/epimerase